VKEHITKRLIDELKPRASSHIVWDDDLPRFGVKVTPGGVKSFVVDYTTAGGRRRRQTIGRYGILTISRARDKALVILGQVADGEDPLDKRQTLRAGQTLKEFAAEYLAHVATYKKQNSLDLNTYHLDEIIVPKLGSLKLDAVSREDVARLHRSLVASPVTANRMVSTLSHLYTIAASWGRVPQGCNPCEGVDRFRETRRARYLSDVELARLGRVLIGLEATYPYKVRAVRLLVLTGCRVGEILSARWADVQLDQSILHLPDSKTGMGNVALGDAAVSLLKGCDRDGSEWLIPGGRRGNHLSVVAFEDWWRQKVRDQAGIPDVRLHDLRHTVGSVGANTGEAMMHIRGVLRHINVSTTERYAHLSRGPVHEAADRISAHIAAAMAAPAPDQGKVIDLDERRKKA
jgi:integrase